MSARAVSAAWQISLGVAHRKPFLKTSANIPKLGRKGVLTRLQDAPIIHATITSFSFLESS